ncbi:hypothetical protein PS385_05340 [Limosilactobacillus fermentum]|uniref:hypothetical protein n=1 Tax=Limosilactobacillus fermentum TaxID=1613 RepID=UPI002F2694BE
MITERTMREGLIDLCRHDQERLVKMALAKLHVSKFHRHYDDFYQEGCILTPGPTSPSKAVSTPNATASMPLLIS